jgi:hypothetical protein
MANPWTSVRCLFESPILDERKWGKIPAIEADAFILDLEDAVPRDGKLAARAKVVEYLHRPEYFGGALTVPRPNPLDTPWGHDDVLAPVVFVEHRLLYGKKGTRPPPDHLVPLGKAAIRRRGTDVTVVSWSRMVDFALEAADTVARRGISAEVIDLRTVSPLDEEAILESVRRTTRLVIAHDAVVSGGIGAEIAARVGDHAVWRLDAPIKRVGPPFTPAPYSPALEEQWVPTADDIVAAIDEVCADR